MAERRYDEKELAAILRTAAESQAADTASIEPRGMTLPEIQKLAAEVGIDSAHIEAAATGLDQQPEAKKGFHWGGAPSRQVLERTCEGDLDDLAWEEAVAEMRSAIGCVGTCSTMGSSREWTGGTDTITAHLSATPRGGRTRLRLTLKQDGVLIVGWLSGIVVALLSAVLTGVALSKAGFPAFPVLCTVLTTVCLVIAGTQHLIGRWNRKNLAKVRRAMDHATELVSTAPTVTKNLERALEADSTVELRNR